MDPKTPPSVRLSEDETRPPSPARVRELDAEIADLNRRLLDEAKTHCGYCGKRKRGWRATEPVLCAACDRNGIE
jgi:hypothetical protein